jgi:predicted secreted hydrolase
VEVVGTWNSQKSGGVYPNRWRIRVLPAGIDVELASLVADQELHTTGSTGIVYWEGAAGCRGMSGERPVTGEGYVEMTGYAGTIGGAF